MTDLPKKLNQDAIAEALVEVRFECPDSLNFPELVVGRLAGFEKWRGFNKVRLPLSDIPPSIRIQDPNLRFQPVMELQSPNSGRTVKIGPNVVSYHALAPYPGWDSFSKEIEATLEFIFKELPSFEATRIGFRYINILTNAQHYIESVDSLEYSVTIGGEKLEGAQNLNYRRKAGANHSVLVRIASPEFVTVTQPREMNVLIDVDVFTDDQFRTSDVAQTTNWIAEAHELEKKEFFRLIPQNVLTRLIEA